MLCTALYLLKNYALFFYPIFKTYQQVRGVHQKDETTLWSYFWVLYTVFTLIEYFTYGLVFYIPLYTWFKALFFLWSYHPNFQGALLVGEVFKPVLQNLAEKTQPLQQKLVAFTS